MLLCKNRRLFTVAGDNSHVLTPIPMHLIPIPIPWLTLLPFPRESHGIPVFPIPMHTSTADPSADRHRSAAIFAIVELRGGAYHLAAPGDTLFTQLNSFSLRKDNVQWLGRVADIMQLE